MNYCNNCGVELEDSMNICPLCGNDLSGTLLRHKEDIPFQESKQQGRLPSDFIGLTKLQRIKVFWQLSGIILISGMIVTFIIDLIINQSITWSRFSMSACLALFVNITLIVFFKNKIAIALAGNFLFTSMLLVLFDVFNENIGWGTKLGVPLLFSFFLVVYLLIYLVRRSKQRGINLIAYFLIASGILSLSVEGIISIQIDNRLSFQWSVIVLASVLSISAILLFIHYRLRKGTDLERFFHI
jgi:hypothetical protein